MWTYLEVAWDCLYSRRRCGWDRVEAAQKQRQVRRQQAAAPFAESGILAAGMNWQALTPITKQ
jgi:hypothetical protein